LWIGTEFAGVNILKKNKKFRVIGYEKNNKNTLPLDNYNSVIVDKHRNVWVATDVNGLYFFDKNYPEKAIKDNNITKINSRIFDLYYNEVNDKLWMGSDKGIIGYNLVKQTVENRFVYKKDFSGLTGNAIFSIDKDLQNNLWAGAFLRGVNKINLKTGKIIHFRHDKEDPKSLSSDKVTDIKVDANNTVWISTENGLNRYNSDKGNFSIYKNNIKDSASLSSNWINCLHAGKNFLWIGTRNGLNKLDYQTHKIESYNKKLLLPSNNITAVIHDNSDNIWFTTEKNIVKMNAKTEDVLVYSKSDGLHNKQYIPDFGWQDFSFSDDFSFKDKQGYLYFGGIGGMVIFHPDSIPINKYKAPVVIDCIRVNGKKMKTTDLELNPDQNHLEIQFTILNFIQPDKNKYAWKLEGFDDKWQYGNGTSKAEYFNIPYGNYTFKYKAANNDGIWNTEKKPLHIYIKPRFYQTNFFKMLIVLFIGLITFSFLMYKWYLKKLIVKQQKALRYSNSNLNRKKMEIINNNLMNLLSEQQVYLEPDLSMQKLANLIQTKPNYLSQTINQLHNKHFSEFINTYRIDFAKKLLKETYLKIEAIAYDSGFNSLSTFNTVFKKETGFTPSKYRKINTE
jgi:AraC-like DNA-binding protein/frataxin-like iron-binding protein CyaY